MATWSDLSRESFRAARLARQERCYRSSVSRSYYAAYAAISQILTEKGVAFASSRQGPAHAQVRQMIESNIGGIRPRGAPRIRSEQRHRLKRNINLLYENRLDADYRPDRVVDAEAARSSLIAASSLLGALGMTP